MELLKLDERLEDFKWKDITFHFRSAMATGDKFNLTVSGALREDGKTVFRPLEFYRTLVRTFVVGWTGVTENGKPVPYSFELLSQRIPMNDPQEDDLFISLGTAIAEKLGIFKPKENGLKNA